MSALGETTPDLEAFCKQLAPAARKPRAVRELYAILTAADAEAQLAQRIAWLERLARWLRAGTLPVLLVESRPKGEKGEKAAKASKAPSEPPRTARLRLLVRALEELPVLRAQAARSVASVLRDSSAFLLLSRLGLPGDRSFLAETIDRISRRVLPMPSDDGELAQVIERLFSTQKDAAWLASLEPELAHKLVVVLDDGSTWKPLHRSASDAALLLATRVSALGLSEDIRVRSPSVSLRESPLFQLPRACDALLEMLERHSHASAEQMAEQMQPAVERVRFLLAECSSTVEQVIRELERFGVSVDVVYRLEVMTKNMVRLRTLIEQLTPGPEQLRARHASQLLARLVEDRIRDRSILDLGRSNLHLLARKIIERAGHTGEHYITATRGEYWKMLGSAAGGGVLTAGTAAMKFMIVWAHLAPFIEGFLAGANYAASFLLMQALGFTLATKQPSMTAAALAATLRETTARPELDELVTMIARITRSQLAAAVGNIGLVIPAAAALDYACATKLGRSFLDHETAEHVLHSLNPFESGTIFYAALTGVLLWLSSIAAGWIENWAVYRRIPEALAHHRIGRIVGRRSMAWLSRAFSRNLSGAGGNVALGFLLGMTPVLGKFFGLPFDVRHVTLSTGALVLAAGSLGMTEALSAGLWTACLGIAVIGLLNFGVSFVLALLVALRAREVNRSDRLRLARAIIARLATHPSEFLFPPARALPVKSGTTI
jgi:site-specific recombinase